MLTKCPPTGSNQRNLWILCLGLTLSKSGQWPNARQMRSISIEKLPHSHSSPLYQGTKRKRFRGEYSPFFFLGQMAFWPKKINLKRWTAPEGEITFMRSYYPSKKISTKNWVRGFINATELISSKLIPFALRPSWNTAKYCHHPPPQKYTTPWPQKTRKYMSKGDILGSLGFLKPQTKQKPSKISCDSKIQKHTPPPDVPPTQNLGWNGWQSHIGEFIFRWSYLRGGTVIELQINIRVFKDSNVIPHTLIIRIGVHKQPPPPSTWLETCKPRPRLRCVWPFGSREGGRGETNLFGILFGALQDFTKRHWVIVLGVENNIWLPKPGMCVVHTWIIVIHLIHLFHLGVAESVETCQRVVVRGQVPHDALKRAMRICRQHGELRLGLAFLSMKKILLLSNN